MPAKRRKWIWWILALALAYLASPYVCVGLLWHRLGQRDAPGLAKSVDFESVAKSLEEWESSDWQERYRVVAAEDSLADPRAQTYVPVALLPVLAQVLSESDSVSRLLSGEGVPLAADLEARPRRAFLSADAGQSGGARLRLQKVDNYRVEKVFLTALDTFEVRLGELEVALTLESDSEDFVEPVELDLSIETVRLHWVRTGLAWRLSSVSIGGAVQCTVFSLAPPGTDELAGLWSLGGGLDEELEFMAGPDGLRGEVLTSNTALFDSQPMSDLETVAQVVRFRWRESDGVATARVWRDRAGGRHLKVRRADGLEVLTELQASSGKADPADLHGLWRTVDNALLLELEKDQGRLVSGELQLRAAPIDDPGPLNLTGSSGRRCYFTWQYAGAGGSFSLVRANATWWLSLLDDPKRIRQWTVPRGHVGLVKMGSLVELAPGELNGCWRSLPAVTRLLIAEADGRVRIGGEFERGSATGRIEGGSRVSRRRLGFGWELAGHHENGVIEKQLDGTIRMIFNPASSSAANWIPLQRWDVGCQLQVDLGSLQVTATGAPIPPVPVRISGNLGDLREVEVTVRLPGGAPLSNDDVHVELTGGQWWIRFGEAARQPASSLTLTVTVREGERTGSAELRLAPAGTVRPDDGGATNYWVGRWYSPLLGDLRIEKTAAGGLRGSFSYMGEAGTLQSLAVASRAMTGSYQCGATTGRLTARWAGADSFTADFVDSEGRTWASQTFRRRQAN